VPVVDGEEVDDDDHRDEEGDGERDLKGRKADR
jgi:hypothetical protein